MQRSSIGIAVVVAVASGSAALGASSASFVRANHLLSSRADGRSEAQANRPPRRRSVGSVSRRVRIGGNPDGAASGDGSLWVAAFGTNRLSRLEPATGRRIASIAVGDGPIALTVGPDAVWVANYDGGTVSRVDPTTNRVRATIVVGTQPTGLALVNDQLWVFNQGDGTASVIDKI